MINTPEFALLLLIGILGSIAQLLIKGGASEQICNGFPWITLAGISLLIVNFGLFVFLLKNLPLGKALPCIALQNILIPLGGKFFFAEKFKTFFWVGIGFIIGGIYLTSL